MRTNRMASRQLQLLPPRLLRLALSALVRFLSLVYKPFLCLTLEFDANRVEALDPIAGCVRVYPSEIYYR
jgi:hypothetical protein